LANSSIPIRPDEKTTRREILLNGLPVKKKIIGEKIPRKFNPLADFSLKCGKQG